MEQFISKLSKEEIESLNKIKLDKKTTILKTDNKYYSLCLGMYYEEQANIPKMKKFYKRAIQLESEDAMIMLGNFYRKSEDIKMHKYYNMAVQKDNPKALQIVAGILEEWEDYGEAETCMCLAYENGGVDYVYDLACFYSRLGYTEPASIYFLEGADNGNTDCIIKLAINCDTDRKPIEAIQYYKKAYDLGDTRGCVGLAHYCIKDNNFVEAKKYLFEALTKKAKYIEHDIGILYTKMGEYDEAIKYLNIAHSEGNQNSCYFLANIYYSYYHDYSKALEYYKHSVDSSFYIKSLNALGWTIIRQEKDVVKALKMFMTGVDLGSLECYASIGVVFRNYYSNIDSSNSFFIAGEKKGDIYSSCNLGYNMILQGNVDKGIEKLTELNVPFASYFLGLYYESIEDYNLSIKHYKIATTPMAEYYLEVAYKPTSELYFEGSILDKIKEVEAKRKLKNLDTIFS